MKVLEGLSLSNVLPHIQAQTWLELSIYLPPSKNVSMRLWGR
jgi:hypothetical protein